MRLCKIQTMKLLQKHTRQNQFQRNLTLQLKEAHTSNRDLTSLWSFILTESDNHSLETTVLFTINEQKNR